MYKQLQPKKSTPTESVNQKKSIQLKKFTDSKQPNTRKSNNTGIPMQMKEKFEAISGYSFDDVKVHYNSDKPAQLQALAYTQGNQVYVGAGQEKHLSHELGHVVQQKQGIVKPTFQLQGVNVNDDASLEREADVIGGEVVQTAQEHRSISKKSCNDINKNAVSLRKKEHYMPRIIQRYLIIGAVDYTRKSKDPLENIDTITKALFDAMKENLKNKEGFDVDVLLYFNENTDLVQKQIKKWIEDKQGLKRVNVGADAKGNQVFGRKQQGRSYKEINEAAKAVYGWVSSKPNRHREKELAKEVYANPVIESHLNNLFALIKVWIEGKSNSKEIIEELKIKNGGVNWGGDYQKYFSQKKFNKKFRLPVKYMDVLENPDKYKMRSKIATLHDLMKYFMNNSNSKGAGLLDDKMMPNLYATEDTGKSRYVRPQGSHIPRDLSSKLVASNLEVERSGDRLKDSYEESSPSFIYARRHQIPMWGRHSFTAARMMYLAKIVGSTPEQISSVAWSIMAFWRLDYDHTSIPYHTLHEIMDFAPAFGVAYNPKQREDGLKIYEVRQVLVNKIKEKASLFAWRRFTNMFIKSSYIITILNITKSSLNLTDKLRKIKKIALNANKIVSEHEKNRAFYRILLSIPKRLINKDIIYYDIRDKRPIITILKQISNLKP